MQQTNGFLENSIKEIRVCYGLRQKTSGVIDLQQNQTAQFRFVSTLMLTVNEKISNTHETLQKGSYNLNIEH